MTKKKKRLLAALLILIAVIAVAFGGERASVGVIGGADGPTAIFVATPDDRAEEAEEEEREPFATVPASPVPMTGETISVYNWGDYIDAEVIDIFEAETGIKVIYETFETNEDMYAKIAMGGSSYDVIFPSDYMVERMIREQLLQPINWNNVPNVKNIDPRFMNESYDPEGQYAVPYTWGTMGVLYNTEMVISEPDSWDVLLDETYKMDMFMLNAPRDTMAIALVMCGHDLNSTDPADLADAKELLIRQKPLVLAYVVDEVKDKMIAGEATVALVWSGDATYCMSESDELNYVVPKEGSNIFYDAMCIPHNARNVSGAEKFIDFMCRADIAAMNYDYVGYAIPNTAAIELWGAEEYNASPVNNPPQETLDKCQVFKYLGEETKLYDTIWTEIISEF